MAFDEERSFGAEQRTPNIDYGRLDDTIPHADYDWLVDELSITIKKVLNFKPVKVDMHHKDQTTHFHRNLRPIIQAKRAHNLASH